MPPYKANYSYSPTKQAYPSQQRSYNQSKNVPIEHHDYDYSYQNAGKQYQYQQTTSYKYRNEFNHDQFYDDGYYNDVEQADY